MRFGCEDKPRFTVKWKHGEVKRFGTCDPNDQDRTYVCEFEKRYFLVHVGKFGIVDMVELFDDVLITVGYYDTEHREWLTPKEFVEQWKQ